MTTSEDADFVARGLVRSWSDTLRARQRQNAADDTNNSRNILENAFCEEVEKEDALMSMLQEAMASPRSNPASQKLKERYDELEAAMKAFKDTFSAVDSIGKTNQGLSWTSLLESVNKLKKQHDDRSTKSFMHRPKKGFQRVCNVINDHSNVLKMLPQGDKYTSIVTGSLETITKASVNYVHIGEEFTTALEEIDNIVTDVREKLKLYSEPFLEDLSVQLCCKILAFVTFPLKWYSQQGWRRAKASLNENVSAEYRKHINAIRDISNAIQRGAQLCTAREVRNISQSMTTMPKLTELFEYWMEVQELHQRENWRRNEEKWEMLMLASQAQNEQLRDGARHLSDMSKHFGAMFNKNIGPPLKQILNREAMMFVNDQDRPRSKGEDSDETSTVLRSRSPVAEHDGDQKNAPQSKASVEELSTILDTYFSYDQILTSSLEYDTFAEIEVIKRLQTWTTRADSSIIALSGPASFSAISSSQLIASNYVRAARAAGIPCLSYFCSLSNEEAPQGRLRETVGLVALVYALIKQSIRHIPTTWTSPCGTSLEELFSQLDGTLRTWQNSLLLLKELLDLAEPPLLLIVLHGLEILEHEATNECLQALFDLFQNITRQQGEQRGQRQVVKVLFTTSGISHVLGMNLSADDMFDNNRGEAAHSPGRARKGRQHIATVSFPHI
ncbi:hypothetical protein N0V90_001472 [Kalmusia sp. IMI 367209]|nr:hypothetical protein N0V90_001472 [Kalmusia sp. IMI 367209]